MRSLFIKRTYCNIRDPIIHYEFYIILFGKFITTNVTHGTCFDVADTDSLLDSFDIYFRIINNIYISISALSASTYTGASRRATFYHILWIGNWITSTLSWAILFLCIINLDLIFVHILHMRLSWHRGISFESKRDCCGFDSNSDECFFFHFLALVLRQSAALKFDIQNTMNFFKKIMERSVLTLGPRC